MSTTPTQARYLKTGDVITYPYKGRNAIFVITAISEASRHSTKDDHVMDIRAHTLGDTLDLYFLGPRKADTVHVHHTHPGAAA